MREAGGAGQCPARGKQEKNPRKRYEGGGSVKNIEGGVAEDVLKGQVSGIFGKIAERTSFSRQDLHAGDSRGVPLDTLASKGSQRGYLWEGFGVRRKGSSVWDSFLEGRKGGSANKKISKKGTF